MGGAIALLNAIEHPNSLRGVVLVCTGAKLGVLPSIREGLRSRFEETVKGCRRTEAIFLKDELGNDSLRNQ